MTYPPLISQTLMDPSAAPVASRVPVGCTAVVTTGAVCGLKVLTSSVSRVREDSSRGVNEYIRVVMEREQTTTCEAEGVTNSTDVSAF